MIDFGSPAGGVRVVRLSFEITELERGWLLRGGDVVREFGSCLLARQAIDEYVRALAERGVSSVAVVTFAPRTRAGQTIAKVVAETTGGKVLDAPQTDPG